MFKNILFPSDGSGAALEAAEVVASIAKDSPGTTVTVVVVISPLTPDQTDIDADILERHNDHMRKKAENVIKLTSEVFFDQGVNHNAKILTGDPVSAAIAHEACGGDYDLIALGSRGMNMMRTDLHYLGSVTEHVIRRVVTPVLVVPIHK